jgi:NTP pyrophosphatase (non-canonical NTP hydrolase)
MKPEELSLETRLIQLAEESAELAQAALKMVRVIYGDTPVTFDDACDHLLEEIADVKLCADIITSKDDDKIIRGIYADKYRRWEERLNDGER